LKTNPYIHLIISLICIALSGNNHLLYAQNETVGDNLNDTYYDEGHMRYNNFVYDNQIKTVMLRKKGNPISAAVLKLNSDDVLVLKFDDLDLEIKDYSYEIIHCNFDWTASDLMNTEYIDGYLEDYIRIFKNSFNTLIPYVNYQVEIPNENMKPTKSGNYILKVFKDDDKENIILTRRFIVYEDIVTIDARVKMPDQIDERDYRQEVDFTIAHNNYDILNPYQALHILLQQNNRWDNAITELKPLFVKNNELVYDYAEENVFDGGNEFRFFNSKSINYRTIEIDQIVYDSSTYNFHLSNDIRRTFKQYYAIADANGNFLPDNENGDYADTDADYVKVHFSLPLEAPMIKGNFYILGNLTEWQFKDSHQLIYNYKERKYQRTVLLKQGYYNYCYGFVADQSNQADITLIEGNHYETENDYTIFAYYRDDSERYDRIIGATFFNTFN